MLLVETVFLAREKPSFYLSDIPGSENSFSQGKFYINDLQFAPDLLDPVIFADDTNLFYSNKDINIAFLRVNDELQKINEWLVHF